MRKILLSLIALIGFYTVSASVGSALEMVELNSLPVDQTLADTTQNSYIKPSKILFTRVETENPLLQSDSSKWVGELHYYMITRLGFTNIPFNYFVDRQGKIYQARDGYEGVVPELAKQDGAIIVGYLSNANDITNGAARSFSEIISEQAGKFSITRDNIYAAELELVEATDTLPSKVDYKQANTAFASALVPTIANSTINPVTPDFTVAIEDLKYANEVKAGEKLSVSLKFKNASQQPMFINGNNISLITSDGQDSPFAVNGEWDSFKNVTMLEEDFLLPNQAIEVRFDLQALLTPGEQSESFKFTALNGVDIRGSGFDLNFTVVKGNFDLVEITPTETGTLNVRETPAFNGRIVAEVEVGRVLVTTASENGWYKVKVNDSLEGWVLGRYVRVLE